MASLEPSDVNKFVFVKHYEETNDYFLSDSFPFQICLLGAYLLFVLKIGPDFMKNREPYKLKNTLLVYNAIQVLLSGYFVYLTLKPLIARGLIPKTCCEEDPEIRKMMLKSVYIYFLGKITELLDTVFFVLRKKYNQVSFLHVYHHFSVVIGTWMMFKYAISQTAVYACFINSLVHVVMYFYYFMAALGPQYHKYLTWKRHITIFQLVQFVSIFAQQVAMLLFSKQCTFKYAGLIYVCGSTTLFYILFSNFYRQSYTKPAKANAQNSATNEIAQNIATSGKDQDEINTANTQKDTIIVNGHKIKGQ